MRGFYRNYDLVGLPVLLKRPRQYLPLFLGKAKSSKEIGFCLAVRMRGRQQIVYDFPPLHLKMITVWQPLGEAEDYPQWRVASTQRTVRALHAQHTSIPWPHESHAVQALADLVTTARR